MRSFSYTDTNVLLSGVSALALVAMLGMPEVHQFIGNRVADLLWWLRQIAHLF